VLDAHQQVYVSSHPRLFRSLTPLAEVNESYRELARLMAQSASEAPFVVEHMLPSHIVIAVPMLSEDGIRLGTLLLTYAESLFLPRFWETVQQVLLSTLAVLAVLMPLGWYAGNRMVVPLVRLARAMRRVGSEPPSRVGADLYLGGDEIGQLGRQFQAMLQELENKQSLERQMIMSDRLASIGRLTAGIAHEINNPLGGMLNAINTQRRHGAPDVLLEKTLSLLERGLLQIKSTVGALLVEARMESHALTCQDLEDIRTLILPEASEKQVGVDWRSELPVRVALPAGPVRQILINLVLNAVQAAAQRGFVACCITIQREALVLDVSNDGRTLSPEQMEHLFEPFASESGTGLGLWVTYQIVQQLKGEIVAEREAACTRFTVRLPLERSGDRT
jgi:two-component system, NtrC family, sensor kinase